MTDLRTLFELATDEVESPDLARASLATARRRRTRRRGTVASVVAVLAVVGVVLVPRTLDSSDPTPGPAGTPKPTLAPTPDIPTPSEDGPVAPPIDASVVQPAWDPSTAPDLPPHPIGHIPTALSPEVSTHSRPGDTQGVLALSRSSRDGLAVFYGDRGWYALRRVPEVGDIWDSSLSRDGSRMAVVGEGGLFWCPAAEECPDWRRVEVPERVLDGDTTITWTPDPRRVVVAGHQTGYLVDLDTGTTTELPYLGGYTRFDVAADGTIISLSTEPRAVVEWDGAKQVTSTANGDLGGLNALTTDEDALAATRVDLAYGNPRAANDGDGLVVLDRDGLATRAFLPVTGEPGQWVDGEQIQPVQWLDRSTVLLSVLVGEARHLVTWDIRTGDLGLVTSYPASDDLSLRDLGPN